MRFRHSFRTTLGVAAIIAGAVSTVAGAPLIGLTTTNALVSFDSATPTAGSALANIVGLQAANERIVGIDARPTTGLLYGVSDASKVYTLTPAGVASFVGTLGATLSTDVIGVDFNPVADLSGATSLRIVSATGQNLAFDVATSATTVGTAVQSGFSSIAYSDNDLDSSTATALYYVDATADVLKAASSNFNSPLITTIGALGLNAGGVSGFDISGSGVAFVAFTNADTSKSSLYTISLATGAASLVGPFGIGGNTAIAPPLLDLTAVAIPEPTTALALAGLAGVGIWRRRRRA